MTDPGGGKRREAGPQTAGAEAYRYLGVGVTWVLSTVLGTLVGRWLDGRLDTAPLLTLAGLLIGTAGGFAYMYHQTVVLPRRRSRSRREQGTK